MGEEYFMEYLLVMGFVFLGLLLVCVPRPRKAHMMTDEQYAKQQSSLKKKKAFAAKMNKTNAR